MNIVECTKVCKEYRMGTSVVHAVQDADLCFEQGEFAALVGPSGSGKSTLLNLIGCLDKATSGTVRLNGIAIKEQTRNQLADLRRDNIGFIFQSFNLIPVLTAFENVSFVLSLKKISAEETHRRVFAILEEVGLKGLEHRKPNELSGGQQQRVAVARALVKEPSLVLADEPTANLDSETGRSVMTLMKELNKKKNATFIFSTHDKMVMEHAERLVTLKDGRISEDEGGRP
jgi:putative ABC transport system ATP-binding protein